MDDALLGADRAITEDNGVEIGSDAKAHTLTVTAAFVRSQLIHCRLGHRTGSGRVSARLTRGRPTDRQRGSAGATESPSIPLRATESARNPLERMSVSAELTNRRRSGRSSGTATACGTP